MKHADAPEDWQEAGFGLYVHWPFCQSKCPYCDFNSHVATGVDQPRWGAALARELHRVAALVPGRSISSIFFGGGTPSLMQPETVEQVIDTALSLWNAANDLEITLEANPGSVEAARFASYRTAGVNRVSLGVQALNDSDLRRLGRMHSVAEARAAIDIAQNTFARVSFDLIYARQDQTLQQWQAELAEAIAIGTDHLSLYQLTIEDGTVFGARHARGLLHGLPSEDLAADIFDLTQDICTSAGMPAYEISNHARPGSESRHNRIYWTGGDYAGVGPGAHGRLTIAGRRHPTVAERMPDAWLSAAEQAGGVRDMQAPLTAEEAAIEYLLMGLRICEGISVSRLERMLGAPLRMDTVQDLQSLGLVQRHGDNLRTTEKGRPLLNGILNKLVGDI